MEPIFPNVDERVEFIPEMLRSIVVTEGKVEKIGQALNIEGKTITLNFNSNCKIL